MMKDVLKLAVKGMGVTLPMICICLYTWIHPLGFMDQEAPFYMWNKSMANTAQEKTYDTIILGDSVANAAYIPEILSDGAINLALGGTTPVENYYILKEWLDSNQAPEVCYISFMDHHFTAEDCFWKRIMYSHRFTIVQVMEILEKAIHYKEDSIIQKNYVMDLLSYGLRLPNKYITSLMNASFNQRYENNITELQLTDLHGGRYIGRSVYGGEIPDDIVFEEFRVAPMFDEYYRKIIRLCMEKQIQVHIVKLPLPEGEAFTEEYVREFEEYYESLKTNFPEITVDWFPAYGKEGFCDAYHMNSHAALRFSKEIKARYKDDFGDADVSPDQINGINDYIMEENDIGQIIAWISGKDYTLILNDASGNFEHIYKNSLSDGAQASLHHMEQVQFQSHPVYYVSGKEDSALDCGLQSGNGGITIETAGQGRQVLENPEDGCLNIAVIDQYNDKVLCVKSFKFEKEGYRLVS